MNKMHATIFGQTPYRNDYFNPQYQYFKANFYQMIELA